MDENILRSFFDYLLAKDPAIYVIIACLLLLYRRASAAIQAAEDVQKRQLDSLSDPKKPLS